MFNTIFNKNSNDTLHRDRMINPKGHVEAQKISTSEGNSEQKSDARGITIPDFKLHLQSHSNKNSIVVAHKQRQRPLRCNRRPRPRFLEL
jgi:hypothetical protein